MRGDARRSTDRRRVFGVGLGLLALVGLPACAKLGSTDPDLTRIVVTQQHRIELQAQALEELRHEVAELRRVVVAANHQGQGPEASVARQPASQILLAQSRGTGPEKSEPSAAGGSDEETAAGPEPEKTAAPAQASSSGSETESAREQAAAAVAEETGESPMEKRERELEAAIPPRAGGVLLPVGRLQIEPQIRYAYSSVNRLEITGYTILPAITLGRIEIAKRASSSFTTSLGLRYGLFDWLELDVGVPFIAGWSKTTFSPVNLSEEALPRTVDASGFNIGDLRFGVRTQLNKGTEKIPSFVASLSARFPTGTDPYDIEDFESIVYSTKKRLPTGSGFYSLSPSVSFVYPTEPGVVFGNLRYTWNIERKIDKDVATGDPLNPTVPYGRVDAGDVIGASLGFGLSLNDSFSIMLSYDHSYVFRTTRNGKALSGSSALQIGTLGLGGTWRSGPLASYNFFLGIGVTDDSPDVSVGLRVPVHLDLDLKFWD